jgi:hypothetical protein
LNKCHTFEWSRKLWAEAAVETAKLSFGLFVTYVMCFYYLLGYSNHFSPVESFYLISQTITTVSTHSIVSFGIFFCLKLLTLPLSLIRWGWVTFPQTCSPLVCQLYSCFLSDLFYYVSILLVFENLCNRHFAIWMITKLVFVFWKLFGS